MGIIHEINMVRLENLALMWWIKLSRPNSVRVHNSVDVHAWEFEEKWVPEFEWTPINSNERLNRFQTRWKHMIFKPNKSERIYSCELSCLNG